MRPKTYLWVQIGLMWASITTGITLAAWTDTQDHAWLRSDPTKPWSMGNISDAQRRTLLWMGLFFCLTMLTWRGLPYGTRTIDRGTPAEHSEHRRLAILWPIKYLTVLFHEVRTLTLGKVKFIGVRASEDGVTEFDKNHRSPHLPTTYAAGYCGSCTIGCVLIIAGFDSLISKGAAIALCAWILICLVICAAVNPRLFGSHQIWRLRTAINRVKAIRYGQSQEQGEHYDYQDLMVSLDTVLFALSFLVAVVMLTWYLHDSVYLRYVLLFMGVTSSTYAIRDAFEQGLVSSKYQRKKAGCDCHLMAEQYNKANPAHRHRTARYYALWWFCIQLVIIGLAITVGLAFIPYTVLEQAERSRLFIPSPHRYHSTVYAEWESTAVAKDRDTEGPP